MKWIKEHKEVILRAILVVLLSASLLGACTYVNKKLGLHDDNLLEEAFEEQIESNTGIEIDLTPESKE